VFGIGTILGPIMGPALGGWLTQDYNWRWIFYINLPVGVLCTLGTLIFIRQTRNVHREPFDFVGFLTLSLGIGALQLMLDRGELKDWFHSSEIWIEATVAGLGFYLFTVHTATTGERSFLNRDLLKSANFVAGTLLMFCVGLIMTGTSALLPTMLQNLMNYPALTTGLVTVPRGFGSMAAMFFIARVINRVDNRMIILFGFLLTALSMWQMTQFSLQMGMAPVIISGLLQGFGLGCTFVPLNIIALSNLPRHILTQGTAIRSVMRNLGGSIGISVLVATLAQNTQVVHSRLVEGLRPDNPLAQAPYMTAPFSLNTPSGMAALNAEVTRQAAMVAYIDDFKLMMLIALASVPLLLLLREERRRPPLVAVAATAAADD
jgi:MFS transporter, DHA2 family, multidrug resistance protein